MSTRSVSIVSAAAASDQYGRKPNTWVSTGSGVGSGAVVGVASGARLDAGPPDGLTEAAGAPDGMGLLSPAVPATRVTEMHDTDRMATTVRRAATAARRGTRRGWERRTRPSTKRHPSISRRDWRRGSIVRRSVSSRTVAGARWAILPGSMSATGTGRARPRRRARACNFGTDGAPPTPITGEDQLACAPREPGWSRRGDDASRRPGAAARGPREGWRTDMKIPYRKALGALVAATLAASMLGGPVDRSGGRRVGAGHPRLEPEHPRGSRHGGRAARRHRTLRRDGPRRDL